MFFQNKKEMFVHVAVLGVTVLFILGIFLGFQAGKFRAEAESVLHNTDAMRQGLDFFYRDNNRFPTASEFEEASIMGKYVAPFPPRQFISQQCSSSYEYRRIDVRTATLRFCLRVSAQGYDRGWNVIQEIRK